MPAATRPQPLPSRRVSDVYHAPALPLSSSRRHACPSGRAWDQAGTHAPLRQLFWSTRAPRPIRRALQDLARRLVEQVDPLRVHALDQPDLPQSAPFLELLLAPDGGLHRRMRLEIDEVVDAIFLGEALYDALLVQGDAL